MSDRMADNDDTVRSVRASGWSGGSSVPDLSDTIIRLVEPRAPHTAAVDAVSDAVWDAVAGATERDTVRILAPDDPSSSGDVPFSEGQTRRWAMRVRGTQSVVPLDLPAVVGRRPGSVSTTEQPAPRRVVISAERGDVSARHVRLEQLGETLVVADLGSTNGTVVHWSTGSRYRLRPHESCAVLPDAVIVLGDGVEIEFVAHDPRDPHYSATSQTPHLSEPS